MKIITRYMLRQTFGFFFMCLFGITVLPMVFSVVDMALVKGLPIYVAVRVIPYILPFALSITLPVSILFAVCCAYGKLVGSGELIALKSMGLPLWKIFIPAWIVALIISFFAVWLNDVAFSWGRNNVERVALSGFEEMLVSQISSEGQFSSPDGKFTLAANGVTSEGVLLQPSFSGSLFPGSGMAEQGRITVDTINGELGIRIELSDIFYSNEQYRGVFPKTLVFDFPLSQIGGFKVKGGEPAIAQIKGLIQEAEHEREVARRKVATRAIFSYMRGNPDYAGSDQWFHLREEEERIDYRINRYLLATPRRASSGMACFSFVWVGIPFSIWFLSRNTKDRSNYLTAFFACAIFLVAGVYYCLCFVGTITLAKKGVLPPSSCWLGNIVFIFIGFYYLKKVLRN